MLPSSADDPRSDTTALVVAVSGVIGPVPYVMAVAAIRMAGSPRRSRRAAVAIAVGAATVVLHTAVLVWLVTQAIG